MPDYRQGATGMRIALVKPIAGLARPAKSTVASIVQAAACRRPDSEFFVGALPVLLKGALSLSQFHPCRPHQEGKRYEGEETKTD